MPSLIYGRPHWATYLYLDKLFTFIPFGISQGVYLPVWSPLSFLIFLLMHFQWGQKLVLGGGGSNLRYHSGASYPTEHKHTHSVPVVLTFLGAGEGVRDKKSKKSPWGQ